MWVFFPFTLCAWNVTSACLSFTWSTQMISHWKCAFVQITVGFKIIDLHLLWVETSIFYSSFPVYHSIHFISPFNFIHLATRRSCEHKSTDLRPCLPQAFDEASHALNWWRPSLLSIEVGHIDKGQVLQWNVLRCQEVIHQRRHGCGTHG